MITPPFTDNELDLRALRSPAHFEHQRAALVTSKPIENPAQSAAPFALTTIM
jgi:hypothetical protein